MLLCVLEVAQFWDYFLLCNYTQQSRHISAVKTVSTGHLTDWHMSVAQVKPGFLW